MAIELTVNGEKHSVEVDPAKPLLWVLQRGPQADRNQVRLRHRSMRRVHGTDQRHGNALLHPARIGGCRA